jgi:hypothetical protein
VGGGVGVVLWGWGWGGGGLVNSMAAFLVATGDSTGLWFDRKKILRVWIQILAAQ